jgi:hypothetical protein
MGNALDRVKTELRKVLEAAQESPDAEKQALVVAEDISDIACAIRWATITFDDEDKDTPVGRVDEALNELGEELQEFVFEVLGEERAEQLRQEWFARATDRRRHGEVSGN